MQKFLGKIIWFAALILIPIKQDILAYEVFVNNKYICEKQKGIWREFGNDCADICDRRIEVLPICTNSVAMFSCDCGKNKCWNRNNEECIFYKEYKAQIKKAEEDHKKAEEEKKKLEEKKNTAIATIPELDSGAGLVETTTSIPAAPVSDPNADFLAYLSQTCRNFGGEWKNFGNSCAGTCEAKSNNSKSITCSSIASDSCDCGEGKCWYQNKCIKIDDYQKQEAGNNSNSNNNSTNSNDTKATPTNNVPTTKADVKTEVLTIDKPINNIPDSPEIGQQNKTN